MNTNYFCFQVLEISLFFLQYCPCLAYNNREQISLKKKKRRNSGFLIGQNSGHLRDKKRVGLILNYINLLPSGSEQHEVLLFGSI